MAELRLIDVAAAQRMTGLSRSGLYRHLQAGNFPIPIHIDGTRKTLFLQSMVEAWVAKQAEQNNEE